MPILVPITNKEELRQGVLLNTEGVTFYHTGPEGQIQRQEYPYVLVVSRDCHAVRRDWLMVAPIKTKEFKDALKDHERYRNGDVSRYDWYKMFKRLLESCRDGTGYNNGQITPGWFYLGYNDALGKRIFADLSEIFIMHRKATPEGVSILEMMVSQLSADFKAHLHSQIFNTIAKSGFEDYGWFDTSDLQELVAYGERAIVEISDKLESLRLKNPSESLGGKEPTLPPKEERKKENIENNWRNDVNNLAEDLEKLRGKLRPYQLELEKRQNQE